MHFTLNSTFVNLIEKLNEKLHVKCQNFNSGLNFFRINEQKSKYPTIIHALPLHNIKSVVGLLNSYSTLTSFQ